MAAAVFRSIRVVGHKTKRFAKLEIVGILRLVDIQTYFSYFYVSSMSLKMALQVHF